MLSYTLSPPLWIEHLVYTAYRAKSVISTTMYKVDCYYQNIVITAAAVNLQCACLPVAIYSTCTPDDWWDCHPKHVE
jgi:hypothetical protein